MTPKIHFRESKNVGLESILDLYRANHWSCADKPQALQRALNNSDALVTAWDGHVLVGLGNAISDGHLVVYYPHLIIHPDYHLCGIGGAIMKQLQSRYQGFHQQMIVADHAAVAFYEKCGFQRAGSTVSMWIYDGEDH